MKRGIKDESEVVGVVELGELVMSLGEAGFGEGELLCGADKTVLS